MAFNFRNFSGVSFKGSRPPYESAYIYILLFFVGMLISDFATTYSRSKMLPVGGITKSANRRNTGPRKQKVASIWSNLRDRNIFNSDHFLAPTLSEKTGGQGGEDGNNTPVATSLPIKLIGTIIHGAREKSVATVQVNNKDIEAVVENDEIEDMAKIRDIQRYKVIFRNLRNRKLEYIEIVEDNKITMGVAKKNNVSGVAEPAKTNFTFKRAEINKYLENLPKVLQDAKAVPYIAPGSGGEVSGFKLVAIKSGSIYETLGLKRGDIIKGVNGEPVDTAQKAMELYQALKNTDNIQLEISRDGSTANLQYQLE